MLDSDLLTRQRHLESSMYELAMEQLQFRAEKFKEQGLDEEMHLRNRSIQSWMWSWHKLLQVRLKEEIATVQRNGAKNPDEAEVILHLTRVSPEKLSLLTILEIMRLSGTGGVVAGMKTARALITVGKAVEGEYKSQVCKEHGLPYKEMQTKSGDFFSDLGYKHLHQRRVAAARTMSDNEKWTSPLPQAVRSRVGGLLVHCLMEVAQITRTMKSQETGELISESQPAFFHAYEYIRGQKLGVIKLNPAVSEKLATDSLERTIHPRHLPMLVKPRPWVNYREGGYLYNKSSAMRFKENHEQEVYLREATDKGKIELVYAGLDILSSTPWKVNKSIFDVVLEVWNSQERMGKIPPAVYDVPEPVLEEGKEHDLQAKSQYIQRHRVWSANKANNHSDRCSVNYKIEIARAFLGDTIYMPHNLDFRGRAYPIPPHLNHIGDDLSRALLVFAEGKPLGVRGLQWLKIHLANLYGFDKAPFADREKWAEDNIKHVKESATNPLKGSRWWAKADDPWQCLATCMELKNALDLEDPTTYICSLPVHQDGTCNGLQHYAALGGDATGAQQVNLAAGDRPSDVYTHISLLVEKDIAVDAAAGNALAQSLQGKVTRKVVKQTVMTTVYGVTFIGARDQIERQLRDRGDISEDMCWTASSYLAKKASAIFIFPVLATIGDTFKGAQAIQNWLNLCARLISKSIHQDRLGLREGPKGELLISLPMSHVKKEQMTSVIWTTSMGLPIVQPYRKVARRQVETAIQSVYISDPYKAAEVNTSKQASAFPPNFIHSLDATHMMLTALECRKHGLTFASVHDSYWTHPSDVDQMSAIIRDTFIHLHSSGILERLDQEFRERYANHQIPLDSISSNGSQFINKLKTAGSRIRVTAEQAGALGDSKIQHLLEIVDHDAAASGLSTQILESADDVEKGKYRSDAIRLLAGKFVKFSDVIPPVPTRGTFKVEDIKSSLYFFS
ncbi:hypothetical protein M413DRAFT_71072 [Hebeloma cylindrosporum]|uniref:DNA-directed RNA polymerase n=1 Tax=Hebeloma cylindrosporum TaxID=76867 RepID=A0A0C3BZD6_HEBCY|nr:hypothetical protein M413DRAFT_71072 [Hebeloma cylindrosporum h7]